MARALPIFCFALSGFSGLVYETCWIRQASLVFGSTTLAFSTVLATFFGGLALGSWLFGGLAQRTARPLRWYAALELALAGLALLSPFAFELADGVYGAIYRAWTNDPILLAGARMAVVAVLLLPPTVLMGATLPLFCRQFVTGRGAIAGSVGFLYGVNTLGAAAGCAITGFVLLPAIGIRASIAVGAALNVVAGVVVGLMPVTAPTGSKAEPPSGDQPERRAATMGSLFFAIGLVALGNQVLWARFLALLVPNTVHTYTITLTVVLVGIVAGALLASRLFDGRLPRIAWFGALQALTGVSVIALMHLPAELWGSLGGDLAVCALLLLIPATLSGASFPLAIRIVLAEPARAAGTVGRMTALNTLGGIAGALLAGLLLLPFAGMAGTLWTLTGVSVAVGAVAWIRLAAPSGRGRIAAAIGAAAALWIAAPIALGTTLPRDLLAPAHQLVAHREGSGASLAVLRIDGVLRLDIDRWWQGEDQKNHQIMAAHIPMLQAPSDPKDVLVVGFGTGQAPSRFAYYDVQRLDCIDIEPAIFDFVAEHFDTAWMQDPRVHTIHEDGRSYLAHTDRKYDLISIEIGQLFRPGVASFYSEDFYRRAATRLQRGGMLVQFVPLTFLNAGTFRRVVRSFVETFPQSALWYNTAELLIVGVHGDTIGIGSERLARIRHDERLQLDLRYSQWGGEEHWLQRPGALLGGFLCGPRGLRALGEGAETFDDDAPALEYAAARVDPAARNELAVVELLRQHIEPVTTILRAEVGADVAREARDLQAKNLADIEARAHLRLGQRLRARGELAEGLELLQLALRTQPHDVACMRRLGEAHEAEGRLAQAEEWFVRAIAAKEDDAMAHRGLGLVYLETDRAARAAAQLRRAVELRPNDAVSHNYLGAALARLGELRQALRHIRRALDLWPGYPSALTHLDRIQSALR